MDVALCGVVVGVCRVMGGRVCLFVLDFGAQLTVVAPHLMRMCVDCFFFSLRNVQGFPTVCWFEDVVVCVVSCEFFPCGVCVVVTLGLGLPSGDVFRYVGFCFNVD